MVVVSMLPHAEIGWNDHREDAPQFSIIFGITVQFRKRSAFNRDDADLRIAEFKNLQTELGSEFVEYFAKLDLKIIIKNEKVWLLESHAHFKKI